MFISYARKTNMFTPSLPVFIRTNTILLLPLFNSFLPGFFITTPPPPRQHCARTRRPAYPRALGQLIEHMIVPFAGTLKRDSRLLQQVILNYASFYHPFAVETHLHELAEPTGIVVASGFRVSCKHRLNK